MRSLYGTYVRRGDRVRRNRRIKRILIGSGGAAVAAMMIASRRPAPASAKLRNDFESAKGELSLVRARLEHAEKIIAYSTAYAVSADLAQNIFDASLREGIDPELTFRLVRLESDFNARAVSTVGAVGLTQLMPGTATTIERGLTRDALFDPSTNLRVGLRYLRSLLDQYGGDVHLALLAYNRGEDAVWRDLHAGVNPANGYDRILLRDYRGTGFVH